MKTLITGATGYLGIPLALALAARGVQVRALIRSESKSHLIQHPLIEMVKGDMVDLQSLQHAVKGCNKIFHLAAFAGIWTKEPELYHQINVEGTKNLLSFAQQEGVRKVVLTSTAGVMGPVGASGQPVNEHNVDKPILFSLYDASKSEAEKLAFDFQKEEMEVVVVNPTRVYGPGLRGQSNSVTHMIELFIKGKWYFIPGDGKSQGNYVYIDDVINGHLLAMEKGLSGERYILGGENVSYNEFFNKLTNMTGQKRKLYKVPVKALMAWAHTEVCLAKIAGKKPMIVPAFVKKLTRNWNISSAKANHELGYHSTDLGMGLKKTLDWIQS